MSLPEGIELHVPVAPGRLAIRGYSTGAERRREDGQLPREFLIYSHEYSVPKKKIKARDWLHGKCTMLKVERMPSLEDLEDAVARRRLEEQMRAQEVATLNVHNMFVWTVTSCSRIDPVEIEIAGGQKPVMWMPMTREIIPHTQALGITRKTMMFRVPHGIARSLVLGCLNFIVTAGIA